VIEYEILNISPSMTDEEIKQKHKEDFEYCLQYMMNYRDSMSKKRLELTWLILTSRGEEKLIHGPMPDLYGDMSNVELSGGASQPSARTQGSTS
jgi:hypothetical protein